MRTWNTDSQGKRISTQKLNEQHRVEGGVIYLNEIPDFHYKTNILSMVEIDISLTISSASQYKVNYETGQIFFDSSKEGTVITILSYYSTGKFNFFAYDRGFNVLYPQTPLVGAKGDGVTDDTIAIKAILSQISTNGGGLILFPFGVYIISSKLSIPSNTHIILEGTIKLKDYSNDHVIFINGTSNIIIDGSGTIDGNNTNQNPNYPIAGIYSTTGSNHIQIRGITAKNCLNWALNIVGSYDVVIDDCILKDSGNSSEFANGSYNCWIQNSKISGITGDYGFAFYGGVYNSGIIDCFVTSNNIGGITVFNDTGQPTVCHDITISNNTCYGNGYAGIIIDSNQTPVVTNYAISITGNKIHHNNTSNTAGLGGIWIRNGKYITIVGNEIHHNGNGTNSSVGINIDPQGVGASFITIKGNNIFNEGQGGTSGVSLQLGGTTSSNIIVEGNTMNDDQASKTTMFHLNGSGNNIIIRNNILGSSIGTVSNMTIGTANFISGNIGYNPRGKLTAPVFPATGINVINTFGVTIRVYLSGGTVSNVAINNALVGLTSGVFTLEPDETIFVNYTVLPSWVWYGE